MLKAAIQDNGFTITNSRSQPYLSMSNELTGHEMSVFHVPWSSLPINVFYNRSRQDISGTILISNFICNHNEYVALYHHTSDTKIRSVQTDLLQ